MLAPAGLGNVPVNLSYVQTILAPGMPAHTLSSLHALTTLSSLRVAWCILSDAKVVCIHEFIDWITCINDGLLLYDVGVSYVGYYLHRHLLRWSTNTTYYHVQTGFLTGLEYVLQTKLSFASGKDFRIESPPSIYRPGDPRAGSYYYKYKSLFTLGAFLTLESYLSDQVRMAVFACHAIHSLVLVSECIAIGGGGGGALSLPSSVLGNWMRKKVICV